MKAWEMAQNIFWNAQPVIRSEEEQTWTDNVDVSGFYDDNLSLDWGSNVPGSGAPEKIMVAAVQALENRGYQVSEKGYQLLQDGLLAHAKKDFVKLHQISALLRRELANAVKDDTSPYWNYRYYHSFEEYEEQVIFPKAVTVDCTTSEFEEKIHAGWLAQLIGGAMGTMVEGYTSENLKKTFGDVKEFLREPNTYNDDITFELAFLDAFSKKGYEVTSEDIALAWVCGMTAPGRPYIAAMLAWRDGEVSHANNGILGEVFNAVMTSLAFVDDDIRSVVRTSIQMIPKDSEYYSVISYAYDCCIRYENWQDALYACMDRYKKYNWIHAYPNACCEIIALIYGNGDFRKTLHIITMCGVDVDCNAGMIMPLLAIQQGMKAIPPELIHPAFSRLDTYMRGEYRTISLQDLVQETVKSVKKAEQAKGKGGTK